MQATSAAPNPVLPSANSASPVDSQSPDASVSGSDGQEGSPFAAVLEKQIKAPADKPDAPAAAKKSADSAAETPRDAPIDAVTILASMLAGVTVPAQTATASTSDALGSPASPQTTAAEESKTGPDATTIIATAVPIAVPVATSTASNDGNVAGADSGATQTFAPAAETGASAGRPAIVAVDAAAKEEASAENGNNASAQDGKFSAFLDAARAAGENSTGPSSTSMTAALATSTHVTPAPHASAPASLVPVATPVGAEGWSHEVGEKLTWMVGRQENRAELVLNPPQLGRIEVSISMNGDQANASFVSANPAVRDALENAMPHLREVLQGAGISLGQTQVGAESFQQTANQRESGDNSKRGGNVADSSATGAESTPAQWQRRGNGMVDTFA